MRSRIKDRGGKFKVQIYGVPIAALPLVTFVDCGLRRIVSRDRLVAGY